MDIEEERKHILKKTPNGKEADLPHRTHVYKRRWWVTAVFCLTCLTQAMIWNTWGPIAESSELVFGWADDKIGQITNMSSIIFAIFVLPFSSFMDIKGLRVSLLVCSTVLLASTFVRCFTMDPSIFTPLAYLSSALQGFGALVSYSGIPLFAAVWFPLKERASITAVGSFFTYFGMTIAFIIAPQLVPGPVYVVRSNTSLKALDLNNISNNLNNYEVTNMEAMKTGIQYLLYLHTSLAGLSFLLVIIYFPANPPTPPSITASLPRVNYNDAFKTMLTNTQLWIVVIVGALPRAFVTSWVAVFDVVVKPLGVSQIDAGWISFWNTLVGCSAGILLVKFSDFLNSRRKGMVISITIAAVICCIWTALLCDRIIGFNIESLYVSCIILGVLVHGLMPLFYEMSVETAYPVGEGVAGGFLTLMVCVIEVIYLGLLSMPGLGISWMTWACVASLVVSLPLMIIFKERNQRYNIDIKSKTSASPCSISG